MIKINALCLLLLIEFAVVSCGIAVYFAVRGKRYRTMCQEGARELDQAHAVHAELESRVKQLKAAADKDSAPTHRPSAATETEERETLRTRVSGLETQLKEKDQHLKALQEKFADLEKEYMVLYQQQQAQEQSKG